MPREHDDFIQYLEECSRIVETWPKWKRNIWGPIKGLDEGREMSELYKFFDMYRNDFKDMSNHVHEANAAKGFWDKERNVGECIALMHSELSEALEAHRKDKMDDHLPHRKGLEVELADCVIRILDFAGGFDLDLGGAIAEKLAFNETRPPKHGKSY